MLPTFIVGDFPDVDQLAMGWGLEKRRSNAVSQLFRGEGAIVRSPRIPRRILCERRGRSRVEPSVLSCWLCAFPENTSGILDEGLILPALGRKYIERCFCPLLSALSKIRFVSGSPLTSFCDGLLIFDQRYR